VAIARYWEQVAQIVEDHIQKHAPLDIATPKQPSAGRIRSPKLQRRNSGQVEAAPPGFGSTLRHFHLRYFGVVAEHGLDVMNETDLEVVDQSAAVLAVGDLPWPAWAVGVRVVDEKGRLVFDRLKSDWQIPWLS
jgi:hypothetical protein